MKLKHLVPSDVLGELAEIYHELRTDDPTFDMDRDPFCSLSVLVTWCVREIVKMRKERER
jgi:hypothetical protein